MVPSRRPGHRRLDACETGASRSSEAPDLAMRLNMTQPKTKLRASRCALDAGRPSQRRAPRRRRSRRRGPRGARELRQARRLSRGGVARRAGSRGRARRRLRLRACRLAEPGRALEPGRMAREGGAAAPDRRRAQAAHRRSGVGSARADRRRIEGGRRRAGRDPRPAPRAHVRLRPSGDRGVHPRAVDAADDPGPGRGGDRFGLSGFARGDGPAPLAREGENPPRRRAVQDSRAGGFARAARRGAGGDLRRFFAWLGGSVLRRSARAQPRRGGDLARPRRRLPHPERARGDGALGADALRPFAPRGATRRSGALRSAERPGDRALGPGRRSRRRRGCCARRAPWARRDASSSRPRFSRSTPPAG